MSLLVFIQVFISFAIEFFLLWETIVIKWISARQAVEVLINLIFGGITFQEITSTSNSRFEIWRRLLELNWSFILEIKMERLIFIVVFMMHNWYLSKFFINCLFLDSADKGRFWNLNLSWRYLLLLVYLIK